MKNLKSILAIVVCSLCFLCGCSDRKHEDNAFIAIWDYDENVNKQNFIEIKTVSELDALKLKELTRIPFSSFEKFDQVKKEFWFKSEEDTDQFLAVFFDADIKDTIKEKVFFYFSIINGDDVLLSGTFANPRKPSFDIKSYFNDTSVCKLEWVFYNNRLKLMNKYALGVEDFVELIDTRSIEKLLPLVEYNALNDNDIILRENDKYYIYLSDMNVLINLKIEDNKIQYCDVINPEGNIESDISTFNGDWSNYFASKEYREMTYIPHNYDGFSSVKWITVRDNETVKAFVKNDGTIETSEQEE